VETAATPMLKQYREIKSRHQDCILFFRLGDFYEMFFEDATSASGILDLVLTSRGQDSTGKIPMCGIPYHSAEGYIAKLIKAGRKVAICEQVEEVGVSKGIVKRDVIRVITAGTYLDDSTDSRYLFCLAPTKSGRIGFAFCDTAGGTIRTNVLANPTQVVDLLAKLPVFECLYPESAEDSIKSLLVHPLLKAKNILSTGYADWCFNQEMAKKSLCAHFETLNLNGFGIEDLHEAQSASGAILEYLRAMNKTPLKHIDRIGLYTNDDYVFISPAAHYGLELENVLAALDLTQTPMGRRAFRFWMYHPLKNVAAIKERQQAVVLLRDNKAVFEKLSELLKNMPDLDKALSRLSCGCSSVKDLLALRQGLLRAPLLAEALNPLGNSLLSVADIPSLRELMTKTINPDVPLAKSEGKIVQAGIDGDLDELRGIQENGRQWLAQFQADEIKKTGISSLKVGFNNVFGYYIEITRANQKAVPANYIRKQTLVNGERYITPELKEYEEKILTAQDKILAIERRILASIEKEILGNASALHRYCEALGTIDCLLSMTKLFGFGNYIVPEVNDSDLLDIKDGRHAIVERNVTDGFTANDTLLNTSDNHLIILTGPNMAGKSTYIRQTALLVIMAQMGAPIPASSATVGIADKIFTRIGAHDEIAKGQSTFMVEMTETADILNNLTPRSLVILDEIGRGTSTSDGLSLAWALAEYMDKQKVRTLFATHFHELTALADKHDGVKNYNVAVKEWKDKIIFLHKIIPGGSDDSYGIYVAKLAGIPDSVIKRSKEILSELEIGTPTPYAKQDKQLNLFTPTINPAIDEVKAIVDAIDVDNITPLEALKKLHEIKQKLN
jgi:DNA mismatch repair protein MutS